jgi:hypothetical protein
MPMEDCHTENVLKEIIYLFDLMACRSEFRTSLRSWWLIHPSSCYRILSSCQSVGVIPWSARLQVL